MDKRPTEDELDFEGLVRQVVYAADPTPASIGDLAKLAFEMRGIDIVDYEEDVDLALARSDSGLPFRAANGDSVLTWTVEGKKFSGSATSIQSLELQTPEGAMKVPLFDGGVFEAVLVGGPFRWIVDQCWATQWTSVE